MTLKSYLFVMSVLTAFCWGIFLFVAHLIDPSSTTWFGFLLFYFSLFLALSGSIAIIGFVIRFLALKKKLAFYLVKIAFRQSFLLSLFIISLLLLQSMRILTWFNLLLMIIIFSIIELVSSTYKQYK